MALLPDSDGPADERRKESMSKKKKACEMFGSMVFNEEVMKQRLSNTCYRAWKKCVYQYLREEMGFSGAALTDDLAMGAVGGYQGGEAAAQALKAGADLDRKSVV